VKQGYRLILVDKDGVLVSEYQVTERDLATRRRSSGRSSNRSSTSKKKNPEGTAPILGSDEKIMVSDTVSAFPA